MAGIEELAQRRYGKLSACTCKALLYVGVRPSVRHSPPCGTPLCEVPEKEAR